MGGCFSSSSSSPSEAAEEGYGGGGGRRPTRVRPSDEDGKWPYVGERDVDDKAAVYIANFHRYQSGYCTDHPPQTPAPACSVPPAS
ncbi:hypothetical protein GUJ93_ZPchr0002g26241 [Zizania palustris]|uniref:Uncharacterized protein n=1 Tax=Zizania palustris TaxID=103762 RepID=A0A8J5SHY3_ZIZPA|nr:hypothetical protein GUJ93_ZPchr0002g26241 [Zizania palustris]